MKNIKLFTNIEKIHFVIFENTSKRNYNLREKKNTTVLFIWVVMAHGAPLKMVVVLLYFFLYHLLFDF